MTEKIKKVFVVFMVLIVLSYKIEGKELSIANEEEKKFLIGLAKRTLDEYLKDGSMPEVDEKELTQTLKKDYGCFVTLTLDGSLRGCIGYIQAIEPLYKAVIDNAVNAATRDPRFHPVKHEELKNVRIEISILSPLKELKFDSPEDLLNKLVPLRDGVVLKIGASSSTFLPQVWGGLPNKTDFLGQLSMKGGNPPDAWRGKAVEVDTYFADVFGEE